MGMRHPTLLLIALLLSACAGAQELPPTLRPPVASLAGEILGPPAPDAERHVEALQVWSARVDADGDGRLSSGEIEADTRRFAASLDANGDGAVDARELGDYRIARMAGLGTAGVPVSGQSPPPGLPAGQIVMLNGPAPGSSRGGAIGSTPSVGIDPVMTADRNADFRVTADELAAEVKRKVADLDADRDGALDRSELAAAGHEAWETRPQSGQPAVRRIQAPAP